MVFLNYRGPELWTQYWHRIDRLTTNKILISKNDTNLQSELKNADALLLKPVGDKINKAFIDMVPKLRFIGMLGTGTGGIDLAYCNSKKIVVTNISDYATEGVVEITFGWIFDQIREIEREKNEARKGDYSGSTFGGVEIKGKNFGVIGLGNIGHRTAEIAKAFGANVRYWSRNRRESEEKILDIKYMDVNSLIQTSDFITLNISSTPETRDFLDGERINLIKKGAILINPSPMELINFDALVKRLNKNDMTFIFDHSDEVEPKQLNILKNFSNCIVHLPIGFTTEEAMATKQESFAKNIESFLRGSPKNVVRVDFRIVRTPLTGPGYEPMIVPNKKQWSQVNLHPINKSDYKRILRFDNIVYPTADSVTPAIMESWYIKNPEFGMVYKLGGRPVGVWAIVPLKRSGWKKVINGELSESNISQKDVFNIQKDDEIALHIYHVEKLLLTEDYYIRILSDLNKLIENLRKTNPKLKIAGLSALGTSSLFLGLFQNRFNFQEKKFISTEHILLKGKKLSLFNEKDGGQKGLVKKLQEGYGYYQRCKMIVLEPNDFSLVWSYVKK
jgi:D-3-phosphoglycerate dehydrogenase